MGASRIIVFVVSAIAAIGLALIVRGMAVKSSAPLAPAIVATAHPMTQVLVAKRDLAVGTRLAEGDLGWQAWPAESLNAAFITDGRAAESAPLTTADAVARKAGKVAAAANAAVTGGPMEAVYGSIVREAIVANEPVTQAKLVHGGEGGYMAVVLKPGMRAMSVPVSVNTAAGGFVLPGDHVDVLQGHAAEPSSNGGRPGYTAQVLLHNIRVLAIDQASQPQKNAQAMVGAVATLEVSESDSVTLVRAKPQGDVVLALRAYGDAGGPSGGGAAHASESGTVRILRGGQASDVSVTTP